MNIPIELIIDMIIQSNSYTILIKCALTCKAINDNITIRRLINKYHKMHIVNIIKSKVMMLDLNNKCILEIYIADANSLHSDYIKYIDAKYYALRVLSHSLSSIYTINIFNVSNKIVIREIGFPKCEVINMYAIDAHLLMYHIKKVIKV